MASTEFLSEYFPILVFLLVAGGMSLVMVLLSLFAAKQKPDAEKNAAYELSLIHI